MSPLRSSGQDDWPGAIARDRRLQQGIKSLKSGLFPVPALDKHITKHWLCLSSKLKKKKEQSFKVMLGKESASAKYRKQRVDYAFCMIERPGCPEPRARAIIIQLVYCRELSAVLMLVFISTRYLHVFYWSVSQRHVVFPTNSVNIPPCILCSANADAFNNSIFIDL